MFGWQRGSSGGELGADSRESFVRNQSEFLVLECKLEGGGGLRMRKWDEQSGADGLCLHHRLKYKSGHKILKKIIHALTLPRHNKSSLVSIREPNNDH